MGYVVYVLLLSLAALAHATPVNYFFGGLFTGYCGRDGYYYVDVNTFVQCSGGRAYHQKCAAGTENSPLQVYESGQYKRVTVFCDVNLNDALNPMPMVHRDVVGSDYADDKSSSNTENAIVDGANAAKPLDDQAHANKASGDKAPVDKAPVDKAPVDKAPVVKSHVVKAPVDKAPVDKTPVVKTPVVKAPSDKSTARKVADEAAADGAVRDDQHSAAGDASVKDISSEEQTSDDSSEEGTVEDNQSRMTPGMHTPGYYFPYFPYFPYPHQAHYPEVDTEQPAMEYPPFYMYGYHGYPYYQG